jgi:Fe-S cluster biogenesis protein NfuA
MSESAARKGSNPVGGVVIDRGRAEAVVARVRPAIQADGGDIEVVGVVGANLVVRLHGECVGCPSATRTLKDGLEVRLRREVAGFGEVISIH